MKERISCVSNLWVKQMEFEGQGDKMQGHKHIFDHQTLLATGRFKVTVDGEQSFFDAPQIVYIRKNLDHEIECVSESGLGFCIHPIRDGERVEDIVSDDQVPLVGGHLLNSLVHED